MTKVAARLFFLLAVLLMPLGMATAAAPAHRCRMKSLTLRSEAVRLAASGWRIFPLKPRTKIPPHTGVSNVRLVTHLDVDDEGIERAGAALREAVGNGAPTALRGVRGGAGRG